MRKLSVPLATLILIAGCAAAPSGVNNAPTVSSESSVSSVALSVASSSSSSLKTLADAITPLHVPFAVQAPFANWDALHEEACEETAMLMVIHYRNETALNPQTAENEIQELVAWEQKNGYGEDLTADQMATIARKKYGMRARVRDDVSIDSIKEELAAGNPVIIPAAGRDLGNPYFSGEGPWYHALVITGFKPGWLGDYFVTNDPGTKRGQDYSYRAETLLAAIHDWTGVKEEIRSGRKAMVILEK